MHFLKKSEKMKNSLTTSTVGILNCEIFTKVIAMYDRKLYLGRPYLDLLDFCCGLLIKMISINLIGIIVFIFLDIYVYVLCFMTIANYMY